MSQPAPPPSEPVRVQPLTSDWTVPKPPPGAVARPAVSGVRVSVGIVIALAGHLVSFIVPYVAGAATDDQWFADHGVTGLLVGQAILALGCLVVGVVLAIRRDGGVGIGLIIGWATGVPVVAWFGGYLLWFVYQLGTGG